jgi:hypothetical protein
LIINAIDEKRCARPKELKSGNLKSLTDSKTYIFCFILSFTINALNAAKR